MSGGLVPMRADLDAAKVYTSIMEEGEIPRAWHQHAYRLTDRVADSFVAGILFLAASHTLAKITASRQDRKVLIAAAPCWLPAPRSPGARGPSLALAARARLAEQCAGDPRHGRRRRRSRRRRPCWRPRARPSRPQRFFLLRIDERPRFVALNALRPRGSWTRLGSAVPCPSGEALPRERDVDMSRAQHDARALPFRRSAAPERDVDMSRTQHDALDLQSHEIAVAEFQQRGRLAWGNLPIDVSDLMPKCGDDQLLDVGSRYAGHQRRARHDLEDLPAVLVVFHFARLLASHDNDLGVPIGDLPCGNGRHHGRREGVALLVPLRQEPGLVLSA